MPKLKYFAIIDGEQKGPFELEELGAAGVRPSTYVWCKGMPDWEKAEDVADICRFYRIRLHDLMHPGSVEAEKRNNAQQNLPASSDSADTPPAFPTRFDRYLADQDAHIPTLDEIDAMKNKDIPPVNMLPAAIIATILFFTPTGIVAIYYAYKTKKLWREGLHEEAHENSRSAKMWTGISFFLGLIFYAAILV